MAATRASTRLLQIAEQAGAKVIAIGDPGQLASVQAGGWLGAVGRAVGVVRLTEVMRQRDPAERRALGSLHERHPLSYLEWADRAGRIETFCDLTRACEHAIEEWAHAAGTVGPGQAVMIARDNDTRDALNRAARELRRELGALGEECSYDDLRLAVDDRVICRRNDRELDVDNGMRGTVHYLDGDRVVIDTDSGLVRELSAAYASKHLEHAYALTGHGMQGGTIEAATVVATPHDLSAGWSYTALSRARGHTRLLIYEDQGTEDRSEYAPTDQPQASDRDDLLARVARRMLVRDDEDLAIEQLPGTGRVGNPEIADAGRTAETPRREQAAERAETTPATASAARLRDLGHRIQQLRIQAEALPTRELLRVEDLDGRAATLTSQRELLTRRLGELPQPRRRFGRTQDPSVAERAHLSNASEATDRALDTVLTQRALLARELGDPSEACAERDRLQRVLTQLTRGHTEIRNELAERELHIQRPWIQQAFGERPENPRHSETWENGVRLMARYRLQYDIPDSSDALGPRPVSREQQRDWERAHQAIARAARRLGRETENERNANLGIEL
jgi:AAA domain